MVEQELRLDCLVPDPMSLTTSLFILLITQQVGRTMTLTSVGKRTLSCTGGPLGLLSVYLHKEGDFVVRIPLSSRSGCYGLRKIQAFTKFRHCRQGIERYQQSSYA